MDRGKGTLQTALRAAVQAALVVGITTVAAAEPQEPYPVTVRVYDMAGLDAATTRTALTISESAFRSASVAVRWEECVVGSLTVRCDAPFAGVYVVRIVRTADGSGPAPHALGDALVDIATGSAVFATIYFQRVQRLSQSAGADEGELLGHAIAHELGHLLLASHVHSGQGLMRPVWKERELRRRRDGDWQFSAQDAAAIRARIEAARLSPNIVWTTR
jgi:hypothetical protein